MNEELRQTDLIFIRDTEVWERAKATRNMYPLFDDTEPTIAAYIKKEIDFLRLFLEIDND